MTKLGGLWLSGDRHDEFSLYDDGNWLSTSRGGCDLRGSLLAFPLSPVM
jgi:hypothetical protein